MGRGPIFSIQEKTLQSARRKLENMALEVEKKRKQMGRKGKN